jgi:hypothetical protein
VGDWGRGDGETKRGFLVVQEEGFDGRRRRERRVESKRRGSKVVFGDVVGSLVGRGIGCAELAKAGAGEVIREQSCGRR